MTVDVLTVYRGDEHRPPFSFIDEIRQGSGNGAADARAGRFIFRQEREDLLLSASHVTGQIAIDQNHARADGSRERAAAPSRRPLQEDSIRIRRISRGKEKNLGIVGFITEGAEKIDRARERELRGGDAGDKVPATDFPAFLERFQHRIDGAESSCNALRGRRFTGEDSVAVEHLLRQRVRLSGG